ncbi:hypothetical protein MDMS009_182 [Methylophaga thiooxydans DMS010]|uniref:Uncharacterized protein n=1 Tax=Methylophaga thiooxydans DMS010 TaxID=637616 RepID=C0N2C1_9GAMM|nr:hypothetical protein MDMS009_182 [Methylophaga thiooxydans DMS010]
MIIAVPQIINAIATDRKNTLNIHAWESQQWEMVDKTIHK